MKQQNKWEKLFDEWLDLTEFTLVKHIKETDEGIWSLYDRQGANLGDIEDDRFDNAMQILDRMEIYIRDYIFVDLEECFEHENDNAEYVYGYPWSAEEWLKYRELMPNNQYEMDLCDMIANHFEEINLENCFYEEEC